MNEEAKIISLFSPKGGTGVTSLSINLASALAYESNKNILLLSLHTKYIRDLTSYFDFEFKYYFSQIPIDKLTDNLIISYVNSYMFKKYKFYILPFLAHHRDLIKIKNIYLEKFLNIAKEVFDYIIINTTSDFSRFDTIAFDYSNLILLVTTPDVPSLVKIKESLFLFQENLYPMELLKLLVNRADIKGGLREEDIREAIDIDIFYQVPNEEEELINSIQLGKPIIELNPRAKYSQSLIKLADIFENKKKSTEEINSIFTVVSEVVRNKHKESLKDSEDITDDISTENNQKELIDYNKLKENIHKKLITEINISTNMDDEKLREETRKVIKKLLSEEKNAPREREIREQLVAEILDEALGLGPLEPLLKNPDITEIMVISKDETYIERRGKLEKTDIKFLSDEQLLKISERIVTPLGRRVDDSSPYVDARLPDGSRVHIIIPPLAIKGPTITIRKFSKKKLTPDDLIKFNSATPEMLEFLEWSVLIRKNIVISGGTGSGKTTLLNILSSYIPDNERIITVEDSAELQLQQPHWVRLEARPPSIEGTGEVTIRDLVRNCLRMRPDRIVVGECRGGETLDMLQAMNTGHDGSLTTVHSNSPRDCIRRLETLSLMAGMELPAKAILEQIAGAIDLIVQQARLSDGSRKIVAISEVTGMEGEVVTLQDIFVFKQTGISKHGKVEGYFTATGIMPSFIDELRAKGINVNPELFQPKIK